MKESKLYQLCGKLEFLVEQFCVNESFLNETIKECYKDLCDYLECDSILKEEEQQEEQEEQEEQEKESICYIYEDSECTDSVLKGYVFLHNFRKIGEFLYYKNEKLLEIYYLEKENTKYFVNTSIDEIKIYLEGVLYWGAY